MAYNHGREDRKWRIWKEAGEKRKYGILRLMYFSIHKMLHQFSLKYNALMLRNIP